MTEPTPLHYRRPGAGPHRVQRAAQELATAEKLGVAAVAANIALGVPLCLVAPLTIAAVTKAVEFKWGGGVLPGFWMTASLLAVVIVPVLMWYERRTRGEYLSDAVRGETSPYDASSYGEYQLQRAKMLSIGFTELALTGPRLLWTAIDRTGSAGDASVRKVAAEVAVELLDAGSGVPVRQLVRPDRPAADVAAAVDYLAARDWVGLSSRRDRVWLTTPTRQQMATW